jgi:type I restriction enzyme R subunit
MNEAETRAELIDPALKAAGWGVVAGSRVRREFPITPGRLEGRAKRGKPLTADYVLEYHNRRLAVVEAKSAHETVTEGVAQAKNYAGKLQIRTTYSTNGKGIYSIDMETGAEGPAERFPTPDELWARLFPKPQPWRDRFAQVSTPDKSGTWILRFYQEIAVRRVLEAIEAGRDRVLLTLATGTGKTSIAFQICWKLFAARWNAPDWRQGAEPARRPRILFLADRNTLANQAFNDFTAFQAFPDEALVRIRPDEMRKKGRAPKNAAVFFTIFQTFMSGMDAEGKQKPWFGEYPPDFFDFIVIDECHRGGANDESTWHSILEYFKPAVQLGLTATPKRQENADTYLYFGEPVYTYSLKEGINDGFLTPFRVRRVRSNLDEYVLGPDDEVIEGEVEAGRVYTESEINRILEIKEREAHRVNEFMNRIDQREKTLVFCATQDHALAVRDLVNQMKQSTDPNYCHRVTAKDGELGEEHLREFQDNERTIPTILTTSQKLSTGVDARNIRNIVLMRPVNSMIEFKQIVGRGTRLYEGKDYFTLWDFVDAYHHFQDPEWDGEPLEPEPCEDCGQYPCVCPPGAPRLPRPCQRCGERPCICPPEACAVCGETPCICQRGKAVVKLSDGRTWELRSDIATSFWHPDGTPITAQQFMELLYGKLPEFFKNEAELRQLWGAPDTRKLLLHGLAERGFGREQLLEMQKIIDAEQSDIFDVLAYVAYAHPPVTRQTRAEHARAVVHGEFPSRQQSFLDFVLDHYVQSGDEELDQAKLATLLQLKYGALPDAVASLGDAGTIAQAFTGFQRYLYELAT